MSINRIPLSQLEADPRKTLSDCCDSGRSLIVELPDHRLVAIQALDPDQDDSLIQELIDSDPGFRSLLDRSKSTPRRAFPLAPTA